MAEESLLSLLTKPILFFLFALAARAVLSFLETSVTAMRLFRLKELSHATKSYRDLFKTLEQSPHSVLITILIANSLAEVTASTLAAYIMEEIFTRCNLPQGLGLTVGIGFTAMTLIVFGEIIPKNIAKRSGERLFSSTLWLVNLVYKILHPVAIFLTAFSDFIIKKFGGGRYLEEGSDWVSSEQEIKFLISHIKEVGLMESEKTEMLENIFALGETVVKEIMVPATDIISMNITATIKDSLELFNKHKFTRLPVYEKNRENIIGMVHMKDVFIVLSKNEERQLKDLVRPILFIPDSMKVNQLLRQLREQHMHIAIILNEHGSIVGLITLEDLLEEIVGEISDEHEPATEKIIALRPGEWLIDASIPLEDLGSFLKMSFDAQQAITLGGFLMERLQHLPKKGERISYKGLCFQVQKATRKRVTQVLVFEEK